MTEYEMISAMWDIIGDLPISRVESMGEELHLNVYKYLHYMCDFEPYDDEDNEEEEIFGGDYDT
jgi:hypothetical protein